MRCIICLAEKSDQEMSREHVFPESIGGSLTNQRVCKDCNSHLGSKVDILLTNHLLVQCRREEFSIPGKSGKIPNPIRRGVLADEPSQSVDYVLDKDGSLSHLYLHQQVSREATDQGTRIHVSLDSHDKNKLPTLVNKILVRDGLPPLESDQIHDIATSEELHQPTIMSKVAVDTLAYQKSILKIAYELAWHWLGEKYLDDQAGSVLRECFLDVDCPSNQLNKKYKIMGDIHIGMTSAISKSFAFDRSHHLAIMMPSEKGISVYVRVFDVLEGSILVSEDSYGLQKSDSKILVINSISKEQRESNLAAEIQRLSGF